jgi:hypothetical protein
MWAAFGRWRKRSISRLPRLPNELHSFLGDRSCGGWLAEHENLVVGYLLYRATWAENRITVWRLVETDSEKEWAVRERLLLRLLLLSQNFLGVYVVVACRPEDGELQKILQALGFYAAERRDGLLWFSRQSHQIPDEETPGAGDRTHFPL